MILNGIEQNEKADSLKISNHALGRAIDFDPDTNRQNFIDKDSAANECFSTYIESNLGKSANLGQGWEDNKKLAQRVEELEKTKKLSPINFEFFKRYFK